MVRIALLAASVLLVLGGRDVPTAPTSLAAKTGAHAPAGWSWPLEPRPAVARPFQAPPHPWAAGHRGVDLLSYSGQSIYAPWSGTVTFFGPVAGRTVLVLTHAGGLRSTFEPLLRGLPVGRKVEAGQIVGTVASSPSHCPGRACLHWGVISGHNYLNPLRFLRNPAPILLPLRIRSPPADGSQQLDMNVRP
jgi:murein DD-endopeptidase MepM/ murein hydrolase activator NlpD